MFNDLTERLGRPYGPVNRTTLSPGKKDSRLGPPGDRLSAPLNNMWIINVFYSETMTYGCHYLTSWCCKMIGDIIEPHPIALVLL